MVINSPIGPLIMINGTRDARRALDSPSFIVPLMIMMSQLSIKLTVAINHVGKGFGVASGGRRVLTALTAAASTLLVISAAAGLQKWTR